MGQAPPPGYVQVGKRTLPMGEQLSPDQFDQKAPPHHDYVQLPSGVVLQELPAIYLTERDWYARRSSSPLDSGKNKSIIGMALKCTTKTITGGPRLVRFPVVRFPLVLFIIAM